MEEIRLAYGLGASFSLSFSSMPPFSQPEKQKKKKKKKKNSFNYV
jgi:hypothetical protein